MNSSILWGLRAFLSDGTTGCKRKKSIKVTCRTISCFMPWAKIPSLGEGRCEGHCWCRAQGQDRKGHEQLLERNFYAEETLAQSSKLSRAFFTCILLHDALVLKSLGEVLKSFYLMLSHSRDSTLSGDMSLCTDWFWSVRNYKWTHKKLLFGRKMGDLSSVGFDLTICGMFNCSIPALDCLLGVTQQFSLCLIAKCQNPGSFSHLCMECQHKRKAKFLAGDATRWKMSLQSCVHLFFLLDF